VYDGDEAQNKKSRFKMRTSTYQNTPELANASFIAFVNYSASAV
jgi:hypothetical protein